MFDYTFEVVSGERYRLTVKAPSEAAARMVAANVSILGDDSDDYLAGLLAGAGAGVEVAPPLGVFWQNVEAMTTEPELVARAGFPTEPEQVGVAQGDWQLLFPTAWQAWCDCVDGNTLTFAAYVGVMSEQYGFEGSLIARAWMIERELLRERELNG